MDASIRAWREHASSQVAAKEAVKRTLLGHKGRAFDVRCNLVIGRLLSASEDGTCKIWDRSTGQCTKSIVHNRDAEVLRAAFLSNDTICTTGSDGNGFLWKASDESTSKLDKIHTITCGEDAQIYVCEPEGSDLLIAADDYLLLIDQPTMTQQLVFSFSTDAESDEPSFGGHRNPDNQAFVFDAKWRPQHTNVIAVTLSDSTTRILDTRTGGCTATLNLNKLFSSINPAELIGHGTLINWSEDGQEMAVCLGSGKTAIIDMRRNGVRALLRSHQSACYGSVFVDGGRRLLSWSSDCTVRAWDAAAAQGLYAVPTAVWSVPDFPLLAAAWDPERRQLVCGGGGGASTPAAGGGGGGLEGGGAGSSAGPGGGGRLKGFSFMGTPLYVLGDLLPGEL